MSSASNSADAPGTLVSWEEGIGDDKRYHLAHVSPAGITLVLKQKDHAKWQAVVAAAGSAPSQAAAILQQLPNAVHFAPAAISKATYTEQLNQLTLFDRSGKKTKVPEGKGQPQIYAAIREHLGGAASEEEADAWSVMKTPLFGLVMISVIGACLISLAATSDPNYEATGRRAGMKALLNWLGYTIGPVWMSVIVGTLAALVLGLMIFLLIKRPIRQVLTYSS